MKQQKFWYKMSAVDTVKALKQGSVTPVELLQVARNRIEQVDGAINAVPIKCYDAAYQKAKKLNPKSQPAQFCPDEQAY